MAVKMSQRCFKDIGCCTLFNKNVGKGATKGWKCKWHKKKQWGIFSKLTGKRSVTWLGFKKGILEKQSKVCKDWQSFTNLQKTVYNLCNNVKIMFLSVKLWTLWISHLSVQILEQHMLPSGCLLHRRPCISQWDNAKLQLLLLQQHGSLLEEDVGGELSCLQYITLSPTENI